LLFELANPIAYLLTQLLGKCNAINDLGYRHAGAV
jgi:hypothetical protein